MNTILRPAKISDISQLKNFQEQLVIYERPFDAGIPKKGKVEYYDLKNLIKNKKVNFLVAEADNKIVGCGFGEIRKNVKWALNKEYGYIGLMYVERNFRGRGIGNLIVKNLIKWLKKKKIKDIRLQVYAKNKKALHTYQKYGFKDFVIEMKYS